VFLPESGCSKVGFQEPGSQSPDILLSLAQMGNNLIESSPAPTSLAVVTSSHPCSAIQESESSPSTSSATDCKPSPHNHGQQLQQPPTDCISTPSTAVEVSSSDTAVTSSTCATSSSSEPNSTATGREHLLPGEEDDAAFRSDLGLDVSFLFDINLTRCQIYLGL